MILEIILFILLLFVSYMLVLSMRRINQYENFILRLQQIISFSSDKLKIIDEKGIYEAEDETGFFFQQLKDIQAILDGMFETETEEKIDAKEKSSKKEN